MGRETIRVDIVTAVKAAADLFTTWPLKVEYDNILVVDTSTQTDPFLCVEIKHTDAYQANLGPGALHRYMGFIILSAVVKDGSGSSKANQLLDFLVPKLHGKTHGTVRTLLAESAPTKPHLGWQYFPMLIPFWSDQPS